RRRADSGVGLVAGGTLRRGPETVDPQHLNWPFHSPRDALRAFRVWRDDARYSAWSRRAARLAQRLVEGCDYRAVITCGPPHLVHEVGWRLKRRTGLPFVMDMRDPWSLTPRLPEHLASPLWFQVARRRERRVVQSGGWAAGGNAVGAVGADGGDHRRGPRAWGRSPGGVSRVHRSRQGEGEPASGQGRQRGLGAHVVEDLRQRALRCLVARLGR